MGATQGSTTVGQDIEGMRGKHGQEALLWFTMEGVDEAG